MANDTEESKSSELKHPVQEPEEPSSSSSTKAKQATSQSSLAKPPLIETFSKFESEEKMDIESGGQYFEIVHERDSEKGEPLRRIVVAITKDKPSIYALDWLLENYGVQPSTDLIQLINVRPLPLASGMSLWGPLLAYDDLIEKAEEQNITASLEILTLAVEKVKRRGFNVEAVALRGTAQEELLSWVNDTLPSLVVCGSDQGIAKSSSDVSVVGSLFGQVPGLGSLLNASITQAIVAGSRVPVLVCK